MLKVKKGDSVVMRTGKDRGRQGTVLAVLIPKGRPASCARLLVEGINLSVRHIKPNPQKEEAGGIVKREAPVAISNVAVLNPATGKADRIGFKVLEDGRKVRVFKSTGEVV